MANTITSVNPYSTYAAYAPNFRGEANNIYQTPLLVASGTAVLPKLDTYPASFLVTQPADSVANSRHGIITALSATLIVAQGTNVSTTAAGQTITPSISAGVITLTAHATFANVAAGGAAVSVVRLT